MALCRTPFAGHRTFTADIERLQCIQLTGIRNAHAHSKLLLHARIGNCRFHSSEFNRKSCVLVEVRKDARYRDCLWLEISSARLRERRLSPAGWARRPW